MEIVQAAAFALLAGWLVVLLRPARPDLSLQLSLAAAAILLGFAVVRLSGVVHVLSDLAARARLDAFYFGTLLRIIGVAYIAEFSGQVLRDAGETAVASKVELAGKVIILALAVPILLAILDVIGDLLA